LTLPCHKFRRQVYLRKTVNHLRGVRSQYHTVLGEVLQRYALGLWSELYGLFSKNNLPEALTQVQEILDRIGWGKKILGTTVKKWLEKNPKKTDLTY